MMDRKMDRREFLRSALIAGAGLTVNPAMFMEQAQAAEEMDCYPYGVFRVKKSRLPRDVIRALHGDCYPPHERIIVASQSDRDLQVASEPSFCTNKYYELPGSATDWKGETLISPFYSSRENIAKELSGHSTLTISDGSFSGKPTEDMVKQLIESWMCKKNLLFANVPRLERLGGENNEKINFGESVDCDAKVYKFEKMPFSLRKYVEAEILQDNSIRGSQNVISNYWMLEAIKSNPEEFYSFFKDTQTFKKGKVSTAKRYFENAVKGRQNGAAQFIRVPTDYGDTTAQCDTTNFIPSLLLNDVYVYFVPVPQKGDPALELKGYQIDVAGFLGFFQRYIDQTMQSYGFDYNVLRTEYKPGKNILGLSLEQW